MGARDPVSALQRDSPADHSGPTPASLAQWKSSGLLIHWFRVRAPGEALQDIDSELVVLVSMLWMQD